MHMICIFHHHNMFTLTAIMIQLVQKRVCIIYKPCPEPFITPGTGDQSSANLGADFILIGINDQLQGSRIHKIFFSQDGFQGLNTQLGFRRKQTVRMVVMIMWHG